MKKSIDRQCLTGFLPQLNPLAGGFSAVLLGLCLWLVPEVPPLNGASSAAVVTWGRNVEGQTNVPASLGGVTAITAGGYHTVALLVGPTNSARLSGSNLTLLWPDTATGFRVESAASLSSPISGNNVTGTFQTNGGSISIVFTISGTQMFYRLARP